MGELISAVTSVFKDHGEGKSIMPPNVYANIPKRDFRTMPSYIPPLNSPGVKVVNLPIHDGLYHMKQISGTPGELLAGKMKRRRQDTITVFDSTEIVVTYPAAAHFARGKGIAICLPFLPDTRDCDKIGEK